MGFRNPVVWIILITLVVVLFGASRLPDITRNIGKSLKIFKEEVRDLQDDGPRSTTTPQTLPPAQETPPSTPAAPTPPPPPAPHPQQSSNQPPTPPDAGN